MSNSRMQTILNLHPTDVGKLLSGLVQKKMLLSVPNGRWTTYELNGNYEVSPVQMRLTDAINNVNESDKTNCVRMEAQAKAKAKVKILEYLEKEESITNVRAQEVCGFNKNQTYYILHQMCKDGILRPDGVGRGTKYKSVK